MKVQDMFDKKIKEGTMKIQETFDKKIKEYEEEVKAYVKEKCLLWMTIDDAYAVYINLHENSLIFEGPTCGHSSCRTRAFSEMDLKEFTEVQEFNTKLAIDEYNQYINDANGKKIEYVPTKDCGVDDPRHEEIYINVIKKIAEQALKDDSPTRCFLEHL